MTQIRPADPDATLENLQAQIRLRDAAPDLLAACQQLLASIVERTEHGTVYGLGALHGAVQAAEAAIAKAEGRSA